MDKGAGCVLFFFNANTNPDPDRLTDWWNPEPGDRPSHYEDESCLSKSQRDVTSEEKRLLQKEPKSGGSISEKLFTCREI